MDWTISIVTFIIGGLIGYFISRIQTGSSNSVNAQAAKNQQLHAEMDQYKQDVEQHFSSSAELLNKMAQDYSKIYSHMAQSQQTLLPNSEPSIAPLFIENSEQEINLNLETAVESELEQPIEDPEAEVEEPPVEQPNDYVQGTHGIINESPHKTEPDTPAMTKS